jgi:uncharacterized membrane-anchored protein
MKKYKVVIIAVNLVLVLAFFHYSINRKETIVKEGKLILLELAPYDPRSYLQGDYMDLRYAIANQNGSEDIPKRGYCVVQLDSGLIAQRVRLQSNRTPLNPGEYLIEYTAPRYWQLNIGAESFFFQEGQAGKYARAKYGGIKVDAKGNSVLIGLYDEQKKLIR